MSQNKTLLKKDKWRWSVAISYILHTYTISYPIDDWLTHWSLIIDWSLITHWSSHWLLIDYETNLEDISWFSRNRRSHYQCSSTHIIIISRLTWKHRIFGPLAKLNPCYTAHWPATIVFYYGVEAEKNSLLHKSANHKTQTDSWLTLLFNLTQHAHRHNTYYVSYRSIPVPLPFNTFLLPAQYVGQIGNTLITLQSRPPSFGALPLTHGSHGPSSRWLTHVESILVQLFLLTSSEPTFNFLPTVSHKQRFQITLSFHRKSTKTRNTYLTQKKNIPSNSPLQSSYIFSNNFNNKFSYWTHAKLSSPFQRHLVKLSIFRQTHHISFYSAVYLNFHRIQVVYQIPAMVRSLTLQILKLFHENPSLISIKIYIFYLNITVIFPINLK